MKILLIITTLSLVGCSDTLAIDCIDTCDFPPYTLKEYTDEYSYSVLPNGSYVRSTKDGKLVEFCERNGYQYECSFQNKSRKYIVKSLNGPVDIKRDTDIGLKININQ